MRKVAIYGIGANFGGIDVSKNFLHSGVAGVGWDQADAPDLHNYIDSIEKGDIIYIKSCNFGNDICALSGFHNLPLNKPSQFRCR